MKNVVIVLFMLVNCAYNPGPLPAQAVKEIGRFGIALDEASFPQNSPENLRKSLLKALDLDKISTCWPTLQTLYSSIKISRKCMKATLPNKLRKPVRNLKGPQISSRIASERWQARSYCKICISERFHP